MKIEVIKKVELNSEIWFFLNIDGTIKLATRDESHAIKLAKKYESNYREFGVIETEETIYSVEIKN